MKIGGIALRPSLTPLPPGRPIDAPPNGQPFRKLHIAGQLVPTGGVLKVVFNNDPINVQVVNLVDTGDGSSLVFQNIQPGAVLSFGSDGLPFFGGLAALGTAANVLVCGYS